MILTGKISVKKAIPVRLAFVRTVCLCLPIVFVFFLLVFSGFAFAAGCGTPGKDGAGTPSGVVNTYYPGRASVLPEQHPFPWVLPRAVAQRLPPVICC